MRALEREDARTVLPWFNDPEIVRFIDRHKPISAYAEEDYIAALEKKPNEVVFGIAEKANDRLIGCLGLMDIRLKDRHAGFGITVGVKECWGRGFGAEATRLLLDYAFDTLNLNRIWLQVYEYNERALSSYRKLGFTTEGTLRQHTFRDGRYWDVHVMGMLRDDLAKMG